MSVIVVDIFCALLLVGGIVLAVRGAGAPHGRARLSGRPGEAPRPAAYAARIAGVSTATLTRWRMMGARQLRADVRRRLLKYVARREKEARSRAA